MPENVRLSTLALSGPRQYAAPMESSEHTEEADYNETKDAYTAALDELSVKHRSFVVAMETAKTQKEAMSTAGYMSNGSHLSGGGGRLRRREDVGLALRLQRELKIQGGILEAAIERGNAKASMDEEAASLEPTDIVAKLLVLGEEARARKQYASAIKAIELAGKHIGMWSTKIEVDIKTTYAQLVEASVGVIDMGEAETTDGEDRDTPPAPLEDGLPESGGPLES